MPAPTQASYEVCLDFTNDTHDCATIQLLRDYGRSTSAILLLHPGESVTLILDAGSVYKYALKSRTKVANVRYVSFTSCHSFDPSCPFIVLEAGETFDATYHSSFRVVHPPAHRSARLLPHNIMGSQWTAFGATIASTSGMILYVHLGTDHPPVLPIPTDLPVSSCEKYPLKTHAVILYIVKTERRSFCRRIISCTQRNT